MDNHGIGKSVFEGIMSLPVYLGLIGTMLAGVAIGGAWPDLFTEFSGENSISVDVLLGVLVWSMILPTMVDLDYQNAFGKLRSSEWRKASAITSVVNWFIKPLVVMAAALFFLEFLFVEWLPEEDVQLYVAGLVLLGIGPCAGMIFAWSRMANGDSSFTLTQVLINNVLLIVLYAPIAVFLLGRGDIQIPWDTYVSAVLLYVLSPVVMGYFIRRYLIFKCGSLCGVNKFKHYSKLATKPILLAIVFALFAIQAETILSKPWIVLALIIPIATQAYLVFALTYTWACRQALGPALTGPAALIAASSFFEIALAVSISLFGPTSPAVLATTTGILVEIPVMLSLVALSHKLSSCAENRVPDYS